jgi:suppressor of G2 allele of SKP1
MSASTALTSARVAFDDEDYDESLQICDDALGTGDEDEKVALLCHRSKTFLAVGLAQEAFADAVDAVALDGGDTEALLRLGIAAHEIGAYGKAREALERGVGAEPRGTSRRATMMKWLEKAKTAEIRARDGCEDASSHAKDERFKRAWYQSQTHATVEVFARGVTADALTLDFNDTCDVLRVTIDALSGGDAHAKTYDPYVLELKLFGAVDRESGVVNVSPAKVEIRMKKKTPGHWNDLERRAEGGLKTSSINMYGEVRPQVDKRTAKDWDALEAELDAELSDEKPEGEAALNELFQKIYMNADDDTRRAMNKSFQESAGTVLSTDWKDVGSKTVAPEAP